MKKHALLLLSLLWCSLFTGCGFAPMYGSHSPSETAQAQTMLQQVQIDNIPDREGQILRNELIDRFNYNEGGLSNPRYSLKVRNLISDIHELDLTKDAETTRAQMKVRGHFELIDLSTGETVVKREVSSVSSYNILSSEFATRVTERNALENALKDVARQIELQLSLYFNR